MTAEELKAKYSGAGGGTPSLLRSQIGGTSASQTLNAESLRQKYGLDKVPAKEPGLFQNKFSDTVLGQLASGVVKDIAYPTIAAMKKIGLLPKEQDIFNAPLVGNISTKDRKLKDELVSTGMSALNFAGGPILEGLGLGAKATGAAVKSGRLLKTAEQSKDILAATKAAEKLRKSGIGEAELSQLMTVGKAAENVAPSVDSIALSRPEARAKLVSSRDKLKNIVEAIHKHPGEKLGPGITMERARKFVAQDPANFAGATKGLQKQIDDVLRNEQINASLGRASKILYPFSDDVVQSARKTMFYSDLVDASAIGAMYGAGTEAKDPNANVLKVISGAAKGAAFGAAFPIVGNVLGKTSRAILDPISERVGDWFRNTKLHDYVIGQSSNVMKRLGKEGSIGAKIAQGFENIRNYGAKTSAQDLHLLLPKLQKLSNAERDVVGKLLVTGDPAKWSAELKDAYLKSQQKIDDVVLQWKAIAEEIGKTAKATGFRLRVVDPKTGAITKDVPFELSQNYYPKFLDSEKLTTKAGFEKAKLALIDKKGLNAEEAEDYLFSLIASEEQPEVFAQIVKGSGRAKNRGEIERKISRYYDKGVPKRFSSLEYARTSDLPEELLITDPGVVMTRYITGARHRIAEAQTFGINNEKLYGVNVNVKGKSVPASSLGGAVVGADTGLLSKITNPYEKELAQKIIHRVLGTEPIDAASAAGVLESLRGLQVFSMGLSAISNATQSINTATVAGIRKMLGGVKDWISKEGREFALESGAVMEDTIREIIRGQTGTRGSHFYQDLFLKSVGMSGVERFNRTVAANAGRRYILQQARNLEKNPGDAMSKVRLIELGIDPDQVAQLGIVPKGLTGPLSDERLLHGARKFTEMTQFRTNPQDLPLWWSSDLGRLVTQFKSFSYKQAQFIKKNVLDEARRGNLRPLLTYATVAQALGDPSANLKAFIRGSDRRDDMKAAERAMDNLLSVGGLGLFSDAVYSATKGGPSVSRFLLGPTGSDVADLVGKTGAAVKSGNVKPLAKFGVAQIPVLGPGLASGIESSSDKSSDLGNIPIVGQFLQ